MADVGTRRVHIRLQKRAFQQLMELSETFNVRPSAVIAQALARLHSSEIGSQRTAKRKIGSPVNGNHQED